MTEAEKINLAHAAQALLDSEAFMLAFDAVVSAQIDTMLASEPGQIDQRENAYRLIWAMKEIRKRLEATASEIAAKSRRDAAKKQME